MKLRPHHVLDIVTGHGRGNDFTSAANDGNAQHVVAPAILGMVLGTLLEEHFITSMIKSEGHISAFFARPIAGTLGVLMIALVVLPPLLRLLRRPRRA